MSSIQIEQIGVNAYAPQGANGIDLYAFNGAEELTLAQLMMAVCIRQAAIIESQSVLKMNEINASAAWLDVLSLVGEQILKRRSLTAKLDLTRSSYVPTKVPTVTTYKDFLALEVGLGYDAVPDTLSSVDAQTHLFSLLEDKMNAASTSNQEQMIALQSLLSRRDSAFNTSASTVKKLGTTMNMTASNF